MQHLVQDWMLLSFPFDYATFCTKPNFHKDYFMSLNFELIADSTLDLEAWVGINPQQNWVNSLFYTDLGYDIQQLTSSAQFPYNVIAEDDKVKLKLLIERAQQGTIVTDIDINLHHAEGFQLPAAISMKLVSEGGVQGLRMSIRLIANPNRLDNALRQLMHLTSTANSDNHVHSLCQAIFQVTAADSLVMASLSANGVFTPVIQLGQVETLNLDLRNDTAKSLLGAVLGQGLCLWQANLAETVNQAVFAGHAKSFIGVALRDSLRKPIGVLFAVYADAMPEPLQQKALFQIFAAQVSAEMQRSEAEYQLRTLNEELETIVNERTLELEQTLAHLQSTQERLIQSEKLSSLGALVAGVAHELNTPIGNALVCTDHLQQDVTQISQLTLSRQLNRAIFDEFVKRSVTSADIILKNLNRASQLISSFKKVSVDQSSEVMKTFDLATCISDTVLMITPAFRHHSAQITVECPPNICMHSYPGALSQVITNVISNAYIHAFDNHSNGQISIKAQRLTPDQVLLMISDNGKGIPEPDLPKIFDPFFTSRLGQGGSGLGLHICYNLVSGPLHGTIKAASTPGQGTIFSITLPCQLNQPH